MVVVVVVVVAVVVVVVPVVVVEALAPYKSHVDWALQSLQPAGGLLLLQQPHLFCDGLGLPATRFLLDVLQHLLNDTTIVLASIRPVKIDQALLLASLNMSDITLAIGIGALEFDRVDIDNWVLVLAWQVAGWLLLQACSWLFTKMTFTTWCISQSIDSGALALQLAEEL